MTQERPEGWDAIADIGRLGLETAASVVERLLELSRQASDLNLPFLHPTGDGDAARRIRADAEKLIDLYAEWTRSLVDRAIDAAAEARTPDVLGIGPVGAGDVVETAVWLHTADTLTAPDAVIRATVLTGADQSTVPGTALTFDPPALPVPARPGAARIVVRAEVPAGTRPGAYHGHVLVAGVAEVALPVRLEVAAQA